MSHIHLAHGRLPEVKDQIPRPTSTWFPWAVEAMDVMEIAVMVTADITVMVDIMIMADTMAAMEEVVDVMVVVVAAAIKNTSTLPFCEFRHLQMAFSVCGD